MVTAHLTERAVVTKTVNHGFLIPVRAKEQTSFGIGSGGALQGAAAFAPVDSESALLPKAGVGRESV